MRIAQTTMTALMLAGAPTVLAAQGVPMAAVGQAASTTPPVQSTPSQMTQSPTSQDDLDDQPSGGGSQGDIPEAEGEEIVVTGRAQPGAVPGDVKPELQLSPADIRSYGVGSVAELVTELGPQLRSGAGRDGGAPVFLVNGRRTGGFQEIRDLPTEAILRVDILPEEAALKFGYRADQRVVNFVLRPRFRSYTAELEGSMPTQGGSGNAEIEGGLVRIDQDRRFNLDLQAETTSNLLESDRDIVPNTGGTPFDLIGNVTSATSGASIDPALDALAGVPVTVAAVPTGDRSLAGFATGANAPRITDTTPFRTLQNSVDRFSANGVYSRTILGNVAATASARVEHTRNESLLGLPGVSLALPADSPFSPFSDDVLVRRFADTDPLTRNAQTTAANGTLAFNGDIGRWRWSLNGTYDRTETDTFTERGVDAVAVQQAISAGTADPFGPLDGLARTADRANSVSSAAAIDALASGTLFSLPAGDANASIRVAGRTTEFDSRSTRSGVDTRTQIARDVGTVRGNLNLPIASEAQGVLSALGRLSVNGNAEIEQLSDFGTLATYGYGLNWQPITPVRLLVSMTHEEGAPSSQQLGNPTITTPFVRVFDYIRGETVDITRIDGGNPGLNSDNRRVFKAGLNVKPLGETDLTLSADYVSTRIDNPIASFPAATAEIEAAFPERFARDTQGRLSQIDNRPVNFANSKSSELRWGVNFTTRIQTESDRQLEAQRQAQREERLAARRAAQGAEGGAGAAPPGAGERPGGRGPGGGRGFGGRGGGFGGGGTRLNASLYHTWSLENTVLIRPGIPELDLLDGSALGNNGGSPRHQLQFRGGVTRNGLGLRMNVDWQSSTQVNGGLAGGDALNFGSLTQVGLRLFADLGQQESLVRNHRWLRGTRVTMGVSNLFNRRQEVTDADGVVPFSYQPGFVDPLGRTVRISIRKLLF